MSNETRIAKICIDISESTVKIAKMNKSGKILRAGTVKTEPIGDDFSAEEAVKRLSAAIKRAAKTAGIGGGACVLVTGGPHIIVRHFLWPEMPPDALCENAQLEIAPYLPGGSGQFQISHRIINRSTVVSQETGNTVAQLDVLVAAIEKKTALTLRLAAKKAGFRVKRIDIRENAREKLTSNLKLWSSYRIRSGYLGEKRSEGAFNPEGSFVILDLTDSLVNMSVFIRGMFYANRYFGANLASKVITDGGGNSQLLRDAAGELADSLAAEAASIIDYVQYQERGSVVRCILLLGGKGIEAGFTESFSENLDIPVIDDSNALNDVLLSKRLIKRGMTDAGHFLDAYGAAHIVGAKDEGDIDLRSRKQKKTKIMKFVPAFSAAAIVLGALIYAGIYFPKQKIAGLEEENYRLGAELLKYTVSEADLQALRLDIENTRQRTSEVQAFSAQNVTARDIILSVYEALPGGAGIYDLTITGEAVNVRGTARSLGTVADYIDALRRGGMFKSEIAHSVGNIQRSGDGSRLGFTVKPIDTLYEDGAVDFELTLYTQAPDGQEAER